ncbi:MULTISPECIES: L,D-transpeptidase [unclassified Paracoccus (in: a-proteobacteria)]|uniref:L,D-transpeptidase n=1 Tax=unclassified Paracoccus (in: a-proteobacteria) TaxID=2688777 RepID=UPI0012B301F6|nr:MULTISPECIES: L,D-transpeptidase [unclassified Paracoccus (in: a-proteobacteria)]UXU76259.1 L,D-transpeptidase [Paracoccus sp. SMMA_5]UXU82148.1 L,D-transpeptidase [Paracoccus sp. SMMA_5_TC]
MKRRQMLMLSALLAAAPSLALAQDRAMPAAPVAKPQAKRDPYAPTEVAIRPDFEVGSIVVVSKDFFLYHVIAPGRAVRYGVAVGRDELVWKGRATVGRKTEWPSWTPTPAMIKRKPEQYGKWADGMPGGPNNPLGARALYLYDARGNDTAIRIHGTTEPNSIGRAVSNGCIRMRNEAVMDLYEQVPIGTPVYVY